MKQQSLPASQEHLQNASWVIDILRPKPCPVPLIRVGGEKDGAYLLPNDLQGIAACFSPGVNNFKTLEDALLTEYEIFSHMCDFSSDVDHFRTPLIEGKQTFLKKWLDVDGGPDSISMADWVENMAPGDQDLLLQIDIEGAEYRNITGTDQSVLRRFRVIVIELHSLNRLNDARFTTEVFKPFFEKLENDFICVHAHPNNCKPLVEVLGTDFRVPPVLELTLLRKDRLQDRDAELIAPQLPHPLDVARNVQDREPLWLDENWIDGERSEASRLKQIEDELDFLRNQPPWRKDMRERTIKQLSWMLERCAATWENVESGAATKQIIDCAKGKPFQLSSARGGRAEEGKVKQRAPYFFHTEEEIGPLITINLQKFFVLTEIKITNRTDGWFSRCACLLAFAHSEPDPATGLGFPFALTDDFLNGSDAQASLTLPDVVARYVTLATPLDTALHLSNINVMGHA